MNTIEFETITIPKGENKVAAETWLRDAGLPTPDLSARCLHGASR